MTRFLSSAGGVAIFGIYVAVHSLAGLAEGEVVVVSLHDLLLRVGRDLELRLVSYLIDLDSIRILGIKESAGGGQASAVPTRRLLVTLVVAPLQALLAEAVEVGQSFVAPEVGGGLDDVSRGKSHINVLFPRALCRKVRCSVAGV